MSKGIKTRLIAFLVLGAVGIVYVAGNYLGLVDKILGKGLHLKATLPTSGGLFTGSEVTYRGVKVGQVSGMDVTASGLTASLSLEEGTKIPRDSTIHVHNLSAVGEQYLDIEPPDNKPPYARNGDVLKGDEKSLPVSEEALLTQLDAFVSSVDREDLAVTVSELGNLFRNNQRPLARLVDSGSKLLDDAEDNRRPTVSLLETGKTVLQGQADNEREIRGFASDLADLTDTLRVSDGNIETLLQGGPSLIREVDRLMKGLEPTLPVLLANLITVNQVFTANLPGLEMTLVTLPRVISSGFTGTPGDGYGYIHLQFDNSVPACEKGYLPKSRWRPGTDTSDKPVFPAKCKDYSVNKRGVNFAPKSGTTGSAGRAYRAAPYDARTGRAQSGPGRTVTINEGGNRTVFGDSSWQWMLVGPVPGAAR